MANPQTQAPTGGGAGGGGTVSSPELDALYKLRDELQAQSAAAQRKEWAQELIQNIADMAKQNHIDALPLVTPCGAEPAPVSVNLSSRLPKPLLKPDHKFLPALTHDDMLVQSNPPLPELDAPPPNTDAIA